MKKVAVNFESWKKIPMNQANSEIFVNIRLGKNTKFGEESFFICKDPQNIEIGDSVNIGNNVKIVCEKIRLEENVTIGNNVDIRSNNITIGRNTSIGNNINLLAPNKFSIGKNSTLEEEISVKCREFIAGSFLQFYKGAVVGKGGKFGINSKVTIGDGCFIGKNTLINPSEEIIIGDDVGIGDEVQIWTHGGYLSVLDGFPAVFAPVKIGNHVWLPSRCIVLPNVTIGSNVVIGINSLVNKNIPSGCLAAGIPCKVLKENIYPRKLQKEELTKIINNVIKLYHPLMKDKNIIAKIDYDKRKNIILFIREKQLTIYNLTNMTISGIIDEETEDFRDFLRRNGIKFFTNKKFKSIIPSAFKKLLEVNL